MSGVFWYVGVTLSGKTYLAYNHLKLDVQSSARPALVVDGTASRLLSRVPSVPSVRGALDALYRRGFHARIVPRESDDVVRLMSAATAAGRCGSPVHVLIDEAAYWMKGQHIPEALARALRTHQHSGLTIRLTTQHLGDIPPVALQCTTRMYVFRCTSERAVRRLKDEYSLDPARVRSLPQREFIEVGLGF